MRDKMYRLEMKGILALYVLKFKPDSDVYMDIYIDIVYTYINRAAIYLAPILPED